MVSFDDPRIAILKASDNSEKFVNSLRKASIAEGSFLLDLNLEDVRKLGKLRYIGITTRHLIKSDMVYLFKIKETGVQGTDPATKLYKVIDIGVSNPDSWALVEGRSSMRLSDFDTLPPGNKVSKNAKVALRSWFTHGEYVCLNAEGQNRAKKRKYRRLANDSGSIYPQASQGAEKKTFNLPSGDVASVSSATHVDNTVVVDNSSDISVNSPDVASVSPVTQEGTVDVDAVLSESYSSADIDAEVDTADAYERAFKAETGMGSEADFASVDDKGNVYQVPKPKGKRRAAVEDEFEPRVLTTQLIATIRGNMGSTPKGKHSTGDLDDAEFRESAINDLNKVGGPQVTYSYTELESAIIKSALLKYMSDSTDPKIKNILEVTLWRMM